MKKLNSGIRALSVAAALLIAAGGVQASLPYVSGNIMQAIAAAGAGGAIVGTVIDNPSKMPSTRITIKQGKVQSLTGAAPHKKQYFIVGDMKLLPGTIIPVITALPSGHAAACKTIVQQQRHSAWLSNINAYQYLGVTSIPKRLYCQGRRYGSNTTD